MQLCDTLGVALGTGVVGAIVGAGHSLDWARGTALTYAFALCAALAVVTSFAARRLPPVLHATST